MLSRSMGSIGAWRVINIGPPASVECLPDAGRLPRRDARCYPSALALGCAACCFLSLLSRDPCQPHETLHAFCGAVAEQACLIGEFEELYEIRDRSGGFEAANHSEMGLGGIA